MKKSTAYCKAKGRRLQNYIRDKIRELTNLGEGDVDSQTMGCTGTDIRLSPLGQRRFPWAVEAKNQEKWDIGNYWKQTLSNSSEDLKPLLVIKKNHHEALAICRVDDLFGLLERINDLCDEVNNLHWQLANEERKNG